MEAWSPGVLRALGSAVEAHLKAGRGASFTPQNITVLLLALANLIGAAGPVEEQTAAASAAEALLGEAERRVGEFNTRDITNTTSAAVMLGSSRRRGALLQRLGDQAVARLSDFNSQELLKVTPRGPGCQRPLAPLPLPSLLLLLTAPPSPLPLPIPSLLPFTSPPSSLLFLFLTPLSSSSSSKNYHS